MKLASAVTATGTIGSKELGDGDARITRAEKKALSRRRILDAAREVFFRDGFMLANLDEVAQQAGVAKGTLYRYFESKADLYVAVLAENGKAFTDKMREVAGQDQSSMENVLAIADFYLDHWLHHSDYFQIFWAVDNESLIGGLPKEALAEVSKLWESSLSILNDVIQQGVDRGELESCDTWEVANILWTLGNGLIQSEFTAARRELRRSPLREVYRNGINLIVTGLMRSDPARS